MKLWLDDVRATPDPYWVGVLTAAKCIEYLKALQFDTLSLDHDLGDVVNGTGYDVVLWMEREVYTNPHYIPPAEILIHSANPVGRANMLAGIASIRKCLANRNNA